MFASPLSQADFRPRFPGGFLEGSVVRDRPYRNPCIDPARGRTQVRVFGQLESGEVSGAEPLQAPDARSGAAPAGSCSEELRRGSRGTGRVQGGDLRPGVRVNGAAPAKDEADWGIPGRAVAFLIRILYQPISRRMWPRMCRFTPTCSEYAAQAVEKYGVLKGSAMACWRILRCNPLARGGDDPVR